MRIIFNVTIALMMFSLIANANPMKKNGKPNKDFVFEVVFDHPIKEMPYLLIYTHGYNKFDTELTENLKLKAKSSNGNSCVFELKNQAKPLYFSMWLSDNVWEKAILKEFHFEPGDHVKMMLNRTKSPNGYNLKFSGAGSAKYRCQNEFEDAVRSVDRNNKAEFTDEGYNIDNKTLKYIEVLYKIIEKYKPEMSDYSYNLLHADVVGHMLRSIFSTVYARLSILIERKDTLGFKKAADDFTGKFKYDFTNNIPENVLVDSKEYADFLLRKIECKVIVENRMVDYKIIYQNIKEVKSSRLRDKMMANFIARSWIRMNDDFEGILNDALECVKDQEALVKLKKFKHHDRGNKAYNFSLPDVKGKMVSLDDFKGKVVFVDFWFTGCTYCKLYYKHELSVVEKMYEHNPDVVFITISIDDDKEMWLKSLNGGEYTSAKAINLYTNGEGIRSGVIKYYNIFSYPCPMLIGKKAQIIKLTGDELRNKEVLIHEIEKELTIK